MLYALLQKGNVIGLFNDPDVCQNMRLGLISNNFCDGSDLLIEIFYTNSILKVHCSELDVKSTFTTESENVSDNNTVVTTTESPVELTSEQRKEIIKMDERKRKEEYNLHVLKQRKERIENQKRVYNVDVELYEKFKKIKQENPTFEIPDMFEKKYEVFEVMDENNQMNIDTFLQLYEKDTINNSWSMLFSGDAKERELLEINDE